MPLSCAIVGALPLSSLPALPIRAVCDPSEDDGKRLAATLECPWYPTPLDMFSAQPDLESIWFRPDAQGNLPFLPTDLAQFGRHLLLDLSLPLTGPQYQDMAAVCTRKGAALRVLYPPVPVLPDLGEIYAVEIRGVYGENLPSPTDHLPMPLNQGLALLLACGGPVFRIQGIWNTSATACLAGRSTPDKIGLQVAFHGGRIGQLLILPESPSASTGWSVEITGSGGCHCFKIPADSTISWSGDLPPRHDAALYPMLLSLRDAAAASLHQGGATISL